MDNNNNNGRLAAIAGALVQPVLLCLLVVSALAVIYSSHLARQLFSEHQRLEREGLVLQEDWGRLLLERSTWSSHDRIQRLAREQLNMVVPTGDALQMVRVNGEER